MYNLKFRRLYVTIVAVEKLCVTYSECGCMCVRTCVLVIQHARRMRHTFLSVDSPALPYFSTLSHKERVSIFFTAFV